MKLSILKWLSCLYKGTTYGYATRKDCINVSIFFFLINLVLGLLLYSVGYALGLTERLLINYTIFLPSLLFLFTIIANFSLFFMRINDIFGRHYFTKKEHFIAYIFIFFVIVVWTLEFKIIIFGCWLYIWLILLFCVFLCVYPSCAGEREEMPFREYKLPKKTIAALLIITFIFYGLAFYGLIKYCNAWQEWEYRGKCPFLR